MNTKKHYEPFDPENWDEMRALAHRMVDDAITYLETVGERPVWQAMPEEVAAQFDVPAPSKPARASGCISGISEKRVSL